MESEKAAIYLVGQDSARDPRLIEFQYLRILRTIDILRKEEGVGFAIVGDPYIDLNFPRENLIDDIGALSVLSDPHEVIRKRFPALWRVVEDAEKGMFSIVLTDLPIGQARAYELGFIPSFIKSRGAKVRNCYDLNQGIENKAEVKEPLFNLNIDTERDYRDFLAFFSKTCSSSDLGVHGLRKRTL